MPPAVIRRIQSHEGARYRDIRLRALTDAPTAFGTAVAEAAARPSTWWDARAEATAQGKASALFIALEGEHWCGLIGGELSAGTTTVEVISMWVEPAWRRRGVATHLLDAIADWASSHGAATMELWVTDGNIPAIALYEAYGFAFTGSTQPRRSQSGFDELCMSRALR